MATTSTIGIDLHRVADALRLPLDHVEAVVRLLDEGNTVPFVTRYRKDQTGGLDEEKIWQIQTRVSKQRLLAERKQTILRSIESQGRMTPELAAAIDAADGTKQLEDLYLPFKPKKQTLATIARDRGLEPLADEVLSAAAACADLDRRAADFINEDRGVTSAADALLGVGHILAEQFSERADLRQRLRKIINRTGKLVSSRAPESNEKQAQGFRDYFEYREQLERVPPHRILAINRGERARLLRVKVEVDTDALQSVTDEMLVPPEHPHADFLRGCGRDALSRLVLPSLEREVRRELTDAAEAHAVRVFARNLRNLLLQPPVRSRRVLAVDPGFKSGCKLAALDEFGNLLDHAVVHLVGKPERREQAKVKILELMRQHRLSLVAIGNGTACRDAEEVIGELLDNELKEGELKEGELKEGGLREGELNAGELGEGELKESEAKVPDAPLNGTNVAEPPESGVAYVIVNEAGASVYSTSTQGREEFPEYDATLRGAISIGRRLQDPLSELVKIDPPNIGVGLYQHDVKGKHLRASLDAVVESCVNYVAVDLNTASPALLRYVSGLNQLTARRVYDHRIANGPFRSREQLRDVPGLGDASFIQAAGFLKIAGGDNPLDATWIHPESYDLASHVLERLGFTVADLANKETATVIAERASITDLNDLAQQFDAGEMLLKDILAQLKRPGRDPREDLPSPIFRKGVLKLDDLTVGMELAGTVLNVVDFGAFVDIGLHDTGLVHISQLANKYVRDPHDVVSVGDIVHVWVHEIDKARRRVSLTMIAPGTERAPTHRRGKRDVQKQQGQLQDGSPGSATDQPQSEGKPAGPPRRAARAKSGEVGSRGHGRPPGKPKFKSRPKPSAKPKPVVPLTSAMKEGKEPLRTFGDLKQFFDLQSQDEADPPADA